MRKGKIILFKELDYLLIFLTLACTVFGIVMIFSASYYKSISEAGDPYVYLKRQSIWVALGFAGMWITSKIDYHVWGRLYKIIPVICLVLLGLLFTPLGIEAGGAVRWIGVGPITVMPGEIAKLGLIVFVAGYFDRYPKRAYDFWKGIVPVVIVAVAYAGLIMLQPNMSTAFTFSTSYPVPRRYFTSRARVAESQLTYTIRSGPISTMVLSTLSSQPLRGGSTTITSALACSPG